MPKLKHLWLLGLLVLLYSWSKAQNPYSIRYFSTEKDTSILYTYLQLQQKFDNQQAATGYINQLPSLLQSKGYVTASVDSVSYDSLEARVRLFLGKQYKWAHINVPPQEEALLQVVGWPSIKSGAPLNIMVLQSWQEKILHYLEENGYPFAKVYLDSVELDNEGLSGLLKIDRGPVYRVDSIRVYGDAKVSNEFLQRYLEISNGSIYNKKKLQEVSNKLSQLSYVQEERPSNITLLGNGSVLNLYLKQKRSSQVNMLIGFLPNSNAANSKKFLITGEANILLRNSLGVGETIGLNWQQLQQKSPRLNILYQHPYIFKSPVGLSFAFDMFRKDSAFLNINMNLGGTYKIGTRQEATLFMQKQQTIVNDIDTNQLLQTRKLPQQGDLSSTNLGVTYNFNNTDYRLNARKGNELIITTTAGTKKLKMNNQILELKDPGDPSFKFESLYDTVKLNGFQIRFTGAAAHYFPVGRQSTVKTSLNVGLFQSSNYFINELFRIGGYKLLRGFDEESQYVSHYAISTAEYRYLIGQNSNFFAFVDGGWANHPLTQQMGHTYIGTGIGLSFETKAGIFNLVWAVGKREDTNLNLRQSKVHLGFINYF